MPRTPYLPLLLALTVVGLNACALLEPRDDELAAAAKARREQEQCEQVLTLLHRFRDLDSLSADELLSARTAAETAYSAEPIAVTRLQLAWLLSIKNSGFQDIPNTVDLLDTRNETDTPDGSSSALDDLTYVLRRMLAEQNEQQNEHTNLRKALEAERRTNKRLTKTIETLEKKIAELTRIEETMIQRKPAPQTEPK